MAVHDNGAERPVRAEHLPREHREEAPGLFGDITQCFSRLVRWTATPQCILPAVFVERPLTDNVAIRLLEAHEYIEHLDLSTLTQSSRPDLLCIPDTHTG